MNSLVKLCVILGISQSILGYTIELYPNEEICFSEQVSTGQVVSVGYQVQDGPEFNADFKILSPNGQLIKDIKDSPSFEGKVDSKDFGEGSYKYCFRNKNQNHPSKLVSFYVFKDDVAKANKNDAIDPLEKELRLLREGLRAVREEQQYIVHRERIHRNTAESTNERVLWWSLLQVVVVFGSCLFQVWYLTRFFEVKRAV
ncbi:hypothetical protein MP228_006902 [Amoeboaphelidium protococcarum]|nr:hypothetical protein MP228_006902 [Amoeboaphelidium protococcarum]